MSIFARKINERLSNKGQMSTLDEGLLEEAFKRALSGGKCGSDAGERSSLVASSMTDLKKSATEAEFVGSANTSKGPGDFSNTYVQWKSIATARQGTNDINLQRPVIIQKGSFLPKQVYLYEQNGGNEIRMEDQEGIDNLFIKQKVLSSEGNEGCSREKTTTGPESNGEDDQVSQETKSQFTEPLDTLSRLNQHAFIRQATQQLKKEAREHLDAKMAQQFMINKRQMQGGQEHEGALSQSSDINFYQDSQDLQNSQGQNSQDNHQFQKEYTANQDLMATELVVLDVDNSDINHAKQKQREVVLGSKRSHTAQTYQATESALSSQLPIKTRKRYNKDVKDPIILQTKENSLECQQEPRVQVDFRNDLLNIIAEKQDFAAERQCAANQWRQQKQTEQDLPINSGDDSEAHSSAANPLLSSIQLTETASNNSRVKSKNPTRQAKMDKSQASKKRNEPNRFRASVCAVAATASGHGQRGSSKAPASRQTSDGGVNTQATIRAERKSCISSTLPKTPTGEKKAWKVNQGRATVQNRDRSQVSNISKAQRMPDANRGARQSPGPDSRQRSLGPKKYGFQQRSASRSVNNLHSSKSERDGKKATSQPSIQLTPEQVRQEMISAFSKVKLDLYSDILRIKKPQHSAFLAGQLLCKVVNSFRGGSQKTNNDSLFQEWRAVQDFIHRKPNVIKFHQEITQLIQHMILSQDYLDQLKQAVRYVLFEAGRGELINIGSHENQDHEDNTSHKTAGSNKRSRNRSTYLASSQQRGAAQRDGSNARGVNPKQIKRPGFERNQQADSSLVRDRSRRRVPAAQKEEPVSKDLPAAKRSVVQSSAHARSPLTNCNRRNTNKTPRDVPRNIATKSPLTQNYTSRRSINSGTRGAREQNEEHIARISASKSVANGLASCPSSVCLKSDGKAPIQSQNLKSQTYHNKASPTRYSGTQGMQGSLAAPQSLQQIEEKQNSKKLYEIMLQKQKQMTRDRYDRLTTNSVSKGTRGKRLQVTPGGDGGATLEAPQLQEAKADSKDDVPTPERAPTATQMIKTPIKTPTKAPLEEDPKQVSNSSVGGATSNEAGGPGPQSAQQQAYSPSDHSQLRQRKSRKDRSKGKPTSNNTTPAQAKGNRMTPRTNLDTTANFMTQFEPKETDEMITESNCKEMVDQNDGVSMGRQKYAKTLLPLQMQPPAQPTAIDQQEQPNPVPQAMPERTQLPSKRQSVEHPDSEILQQMRKVAPAPAPQPAQPLEPARSFEENQAPLGSHATLKTEEVNHISTDTAPCLKSDIVAQDNSNCGEQQDDLVAEQTGSSGKIYVDEDSQSINKKDEIESAERDVQEFDPFVEAQRIAAIIKAECLANLRQKEPSSEEASEDGDEDSEEHASEPSVSERHSVTNDQDSEEQLEDRPKQLNEEISNHIEQPVTELPEDNTEPRVSPAEICDKQEEKVQDVEVKVDEPEREELVQGPPPETPQIRHSENQSLYSCDQTVKRDREASAIVSLQKQLSHLQTNGQVHNPTDQTPAVELSVAQTPLLSPSYQNGDPLAQSNLEQSTYQTEQRLSRIPRKQQSIYEEYAKPDALLDHGSNPTDRDQLHTDRLQYQTTRSIAEKSYLQEDKNQEYDEESQSEYVSSPEKIICREDPQRTEFDEQTAGEEQTARYPYNKRDGGLAHRQCSSENSELAMQEIVSPFRQMHLSRGGNDTLSLISPEHQRIEMERTTWQINPIQVRCQQGSDDNETLKDRNTSRSNSFCRNQDIPNSDEQESEKTSIVCSSPAGGSPCESPVIGQVSGSSPVISPGKLKSHLTQARTAIYQHLLATQKEIEDNSPSRSTAVNSGLIESLKQRRLMQKAIGREESFQGSVEKAAERIDQMYSRQYPINLECMAKSLQPNLPNK